MQCPNLDSQVEFLRSLGTDDLGHSGDTLFHHLVGTARLLESWERPLGICSGGLFHSVYGTQSFRHSSASVQDRELIRNAIGEHAERLAYLFCTTDRTNFFDQLAEPAALLHAHDSQRSIAVSHEDLGSLVQIEIANYAEFMNRISLSDEEESRFRQALESSRGLVPEVVVEAGLHACDRNSRPL